MSKRFFPRKDLCGDFEFLNHIENLTDFQNHSFNRFLQKEIPMEFRENIGLEKIFRSFFPIIHTKSNIRIDYFGYKISDSKYSDSECMFRMSSYAGSLVTFLRVQNLNTNEFKDIQCCLGEMPLITSRGSFIVNGNERVFCAQIHKCPGVVFLNEQQSSSKNTYCTAKIYPHTGSWLHFSIEKGIIYVSIDKKRKFHATTLLLCFPEIMNEEESYYGMDAAKLLDHFNEKTEIVFDGKYWNIAFDGSKFKKTNISHDVYINDELVCKAEERISEDLQRFSGIVQIPINGIDSFYIAEDIFNEETGEIFIEIGTKIQLDQIEILKTRKKIKIFVINDFNFPYVLKTWNDARITTTDKALECWATSMKIGLHYGVIGLSQIFQTRFFNKKYYDLEKFGRKRLNSIFGVEKEEHHLTLDDIINTLKQLIQFQEGKRPADDLDSFVNKRVKSVGEILESFFRLGMIKFEKNVRDRVYSFDMENQNNIVDIFNLRIALYPVLDSFYKVSQAFDNTNYLSSIVHPRKIAVGHQGTSGNPPERVSETVRDVNASKFGRVCPTQTPEGKKIGLLEHLAIYARIDQEGFITTPYHPVKNGIIEEKILFLNAFEEKNKIIASGLDFEKKMIDGVERLVAKTEYIVCRCNGETVFFHKDLISFVDIAQNQIFSISSSLIPFVGHNDSYRVLSAANMNCQSVPLVKKESPVVGTGMESVLCEKILAKRSGKVLLVDCKRIVIETDDLSVDTYELLVNKRTNTDTEITQKPVVSVGDYIRENELIADGFTTCGGELANGTNLLIAYISNANCYEDAFVISDKLLKEDRLTSTNIQILECNVRETRFGPEKNTRDVPNIPSEHLMKLDEYGIVRIGVEVQGGDIIVGKITPAGSEVTVSSEQKLLHLIFGEKASESTDSSLRVPNGVEGTIIDVQILDRKGVEKDGRTILQIKQTMDNLRKLANEQLSILQRSTIRKLNSLLAKTTINSNFHSIQKGEVYQIKEDEDLDNNLVEKIPVSNTVKDQMRPIVEKYFLEVQNINNERNKKNAELQNGYDLQDGVLKTIRVFVAKMRKIEPGDKLCGRHGNKGVVSTIIPECDMPFVLLDDGKGRKKAVSVDILINPLGLAARMNIAQILETLVGYLSFLLKQSLINSLNVINEKNSKRTKEMFDGLKEILRKINGNVINGFGNLEKLNEDELLEVANSFVQNGIKFRVAQFHEFDIQAFKELLREVGGETEGKVEMFDGKTGEKFENKVLFGYQFILKLCHMVTAKMHARSVGPYSLVTLQPLGGKARRGGQRFGEMEVWALEANGAAYTCMELSVKSDDPVGRKNVFSQLSKGRNYSLIVMNYGKSNCVMGNFKLLVFELRAAGFDMRLYNDNDEEVKLIRGEK
jgi:DNA-directed RNA polymerase subunit beta